MNKRVFSTLDMTRGYWQAEIDEKSIPLTAFTTRQGIYEWTRVPMGIHKAAGFFQDLVQNHILQDLMYQLCVMYIDDLCIGSS
jgi:hypothetical protein